MSKKHTGRLIHVAEEGDGGKKVELVLVLPSKTSRKERGWGESGNVILNR